MEDDWKEPMLIFEIPSIKSEFEIWDKTRKRDKCLNVESRRFTVLGGIPFWVRKLRYSWAILVERKGITSLIDSAKTPQALIFRMSQPEK
ncbi:MAG: hypothetical protein AAB875_04405 [Patescibacteria group bacterium]